MLHDRSAFGLRRAFTNATAASCEVGGFSASNAFARCSYSREMVMQARRNESLTDSAAVGTDCFGIVNSSVR